MRTFVVCATVVVGVRGQNWGTTGGWTLINPTPSAPGTNPATPPHSYHHATFVPGSFIIAGNDTGYSTQQAGSHVDLFMYNVVANQWTMPYDYLPLPVGTTLQHPFLFSYAGSAVIVDENAPQTMYVVTLQVNPARPGP